MGEVLSKNLYGLSWWTIRNECQWFKSYVKCDLSFLLFFLINLFRNQSFFMYYSGFQTVCRGTLGCRQKFEGCRKFFSSIRNIQAHILHKFLKSFTFERILAFISNFLTYLGCRENFLVSLRVPRAKNFENHWCTTITLPKWN